MAIKDVTIRFKTDDKDLDKTESKFDSINKSAKKAEGSVEDLDKQSAKSFKSMEGNILKVGAALGGAFTIKQVVGDAINRIREFDDVMGSLSAVTGKSGKDLEELEKKVFKVSSTTGKSSIEIAKAFQLVGSAQPELLKNAEALSDVTEQAVILAQAGKIDVPQAAIALTKSMNQFGASAEEAAMFTDILAKSQQGGTATIDQIAESMVNAGGTARAFGIDFKDTNILLQAFAKGGVTGSEAGTQLSGVLSKLAKVQKAEFNPSQTDAVQVIKNLKDANLDYTDLLKLTDAEGAKWITTLLNQTETIDNLTKSIDSQDSALIQAEKNTSTLNGEMKKLDSAYERVILQLENGDGALSNMIKGYASATTNILGLIEALERGEGALQAFHKIGADFAVQQGLMNEQQARFTENLANNKANIQELNKRLKAGTITQEQYNKAVQMLANGWKSSSEIAKENSDAVEVNTEATEENTTATKDNEAAKKKAAAEAKKQADLLLEEAKQLRDINLELLEDGTKKEIEIERAKYDDKIRLAKEKFGEESEVITALEKQKLDSIQNIRNEAFSRKMEKEEEERQEQKDIQAEEDEAFFENEALKFEQRVEQEQAFADAKKEIDQQLAFSALGLAGAIAQAAGDSQQAQLTALAVEKLAAIATVVINTNIAASKVTAQTGVGAAALLPGVYANGALQVATILATAIPQAKSITETKEKPKFRDGVIDLRGNGTKHSDSIDAKLSVGESVMTTDETRENKGILTAIRNKNLDEYLQKEYLPNYYLRQIKEKGGKEVRKIGQKDSINELVKLQKRGMRITNASQISKPILDAMEEQAFLNRNGWG